MLGIQTIHQFLKPPNELTYDKLTTQSSKGMLSKMWRGMLLRFPESNKGTFRDEKVLRGQQLCHCKDKETEIETRSSDLLKPSIQCQDLGCKEVSSFGEILSLHKY